MKNITGSKQNSETVIYVLIKKKEEIERDLFTGYWKNVHGPVCARLPGLNSYFQFHLKDCANAWLLKNTEKYDLSKEDCFDGIAELAFLSEKDSLAWMNASGEVLQSDENNFASKAIIYVTKEGNSRTYIDRIKVTAPNRNLDITKLHILVRTSENITVEDFRQYMTDTFSSSLIKSDLVIKFRLHLFEEHDNSLESSDGVSYYESPNKQYQAAFEIAFENYLDLKNFFVSQEYANAVKNEKDYIKEIAVFPEQNTYAFVRDSKVTLAGQRTSTAAEIITKLDATNQTKDRITELMLNKY